MEASTAGDMPFTFLTSPVLKTDGQGREERKARKTRKAKVKGNEANIVPSIRLISPALRTGRKAGSH